MKIKKMNFGKTQAVLNLIILSIFVGPLAHAQIEFDLMHTRPECHVDGKQPTFCTREDQKRLAKLAGMEDRVAELIDLAKDPEKSKITIAYFSFSNVSVFKKLCSKAQAGFQIEGYFDKSYSGPGMMPLDLKEKCQGPKPGNVKINFLGDTANGTWRLHHNKFLMIDPGSGQDLSINFSSGNLSAFGLSAHFDHWVLMKAKTDTSLVAHYQCVVQGLKAALGIQTSGGTNKPTNTVDDPKAYRMALTKCLNDKRAIYNPTSLSWVEKSIQMEKIAPLFSPNSSNEIANTLLTQIDAVQPGGKIYGCMQHFLHTGIASALNRAAKRGVQINLLMDDDVMTGGSEVPGVKDFFDKFLRPIKMEIRFMQTNSVDKQMMHNKFLVLEKVKSSLGIVNRVFSGAGHFTTAGMKNNYENFALTEVDSLTEKYKKLFQYMHSTSLSEEDLNSSSDNNLEENDNTSVPGEQKVDEKK